MARLVVADLCIQVVGGIGLVLTVLSASVSYLKDRTILLVKKDVAEVRVTVLGCSYIEYFGTLCLLGVLYNNLYITENRIHRFYQGL